MRLTAKAFASTVGRWLVSWVFQSSKQWRPKAWVSIGCFKRFCSRPENLLGSRAQLRYHCDTEKAITSLSAWLEPNLTDRDCLPPRLLAIKLLEGDAHLLDMASAGTQKHITAVRQELAEARGRPAEEVIESERHALSMQLFESCASVTHAVKDLREQLDLLLTHRVWGYLFLGGMLAAFFGMVYGAGSLLEPPILRLSGQITDAATGRLGASGLASTIVAGLLQGLSGGFAIVLPYLLPFLIGMAILEDVGYLPRVAYLMDSLMHRIGLHGVAIVPAILGYGCNVPAVMATRILTSPRDRFIAAVISTLVPCSARMTVIFGLVAFYLGPFWALLIYAVNILVVAGSGKAPLHAHAGEFAWPLLRSRPYRMPKSRVVLSKTWLRLREFIVVAWPVLIAGSVVLSLAEHYHWDMAVNSALASFTTLLGLPEVVGTTLIFGILRKELSMIMLMQALGTPNVLSVMTTSQIVVFTLFVTFYIPCVATLAVLAKEIGWKLTLAVASYTVCLRQPSSGWCAGCCCEGRATPASMPIRHGCSIGIPRSESTLKPVVKQPGSVDGDRTRYHIAFAQRRTVYATTWIKGKS